MKNYKGNMLLIELVIVLLFFSLSQIVLVQVFAAAQQNNAANQIQSKALRIAEQTAETLCGNANPDTVLQQLKFSSENGAYVLSDPDGFDLYAHVHRLTLPAGDMVTVEISAYAEDTELFVLPSVQYFPSEVQP